MTTQKLKQFLTAMAVATTIINAGYLTEKAEAQTPDNRSETRVSIKMPEPELLDIGEFEKTEQDHPEESSPEKKIEIATKPRNKEQEYGAEAINIKQMAENKAIDESMNALKDFSKKGSLGKIREEGNKIYDRLIGDEYSFKHGGISYEIDKERALNLSPKRGGSAFLEWRKESADKESKKKLQLGVKGGEGFVSFGLEKSLK